MNQIRVIHRQQFSPTTKLPFRWLKRTYSEKLKPIKIPPLRGQIKYKAVTITHIGTNKQIVDILKESIDKGTLQKIRSCLLLDNSFERLGPVLV